MLSVLVPEFLGNLCANPSRLADEITFVWSVPYVLIERLVLGLKIPVLKRFSDLKQIVVDQPVEDIERFLDQNFSNILNVEFWCDQPELFDRLPNYCSEEAGSAFYTFGLYS